MRSAAILSLAAMLAATPASAGHGDTGIQPSKLHGRCEYGNQVSKYISPAAGFARCDSLVIDTRDGGVLDFRQQGFGSVVRYEGEFVGDKMKIRRVDLPEKPAKQAEGTCTIYRREGRISNVSCIAIAGRLSFAVNFVADA
jgi:hypothetical protein